MAELSTIAAKALFERHKPGYVEGIGACYLGNMGDIAALLDHLACEQDHGILLDIEIELAILDTEHVFGEMP